MKVLLLGATGETGSSILEALLQEKDVETTCLIQPSSAGKPSVQAIKDRGIKTLIADIKGNVDDLAQAIKGYDTIISAIGAMAQHDQLVLVDAAAKAGTKRFLPCAFITVCPPGGVMKLRDDKEEIYQRIWYHHLPYTIIDVGPWYEVSFPRLPSGRVDYAYFPVATTINAGGTAPNILTSKSDLGKFTARIIQDPRTLNQKVFTCSAVISQNEAYAIMEEKSGEKIDRTQASAADLLEGQNQARAAEATNPNDFMSLANRYRADYLVSMHVREDNTPENARYLGYLDARELYPDFKPQSFAEFVDGLLAGKGERPYPHLKMTE